MITYLKTELLDSHTSTFQRYSSKFIFSHDLLQPRLSLTGFILDEFVEVSVECIKDDSVIFKFVLP